MFKVLVTTESVSAVSFHEYRELRTGKASALARALMFDMSLDPEILQQALLLLALRHEALRTCFVSSGAGFERRVSSTVALKLALEDWSMNGSDDGVVHDRVAGLFAQPFESIDAPLARVHLLQLASGQCVLVFSVAQALADLAALRILLWELSELYLAQKSGAELRLPPLPYRLSDFVASHNAWMGSRDYEDQLARLCEHIHRSIRVAGGIGALHMANGANGAYMHGRDFLPQENAALFQVAEREKISPTTFLMLLSATAGARALGRQGLFFTSSFSNRHFSGAAGLVGHLATTMPVFLDLSAGAGTMANLRGMHRELFMAMANYGMIPVQEIGNAIGAAYPAPPQGSALKFGRLSVDVTIRDDFPMFGMPVTLYPLRGEPRVSNDFKFIWWVYPGSQVRLWLKGVRDGNNDEVAAEIVGQQVGQVLAELSA
ncbi:condensation domain-containing protein [Uliginosibacterium sp. H1]|uniref:condensation domain-containing protein n=1 Tax=Uliginosibacterium sp. H1 TaxID=3114757 RepID=UPI002E188FAB|nr:condensation domain-containing protein [Uliginosibacterium sp. H1]